MKSAFPAEHFVATVQELGLAGVSNGDLLRRLEGQFDIFVTADKNLRYQQDLTGRSLAIIELPTNRLPFLARATDSIVAAVESISAGDYITVSIDLDE